MFIRRLGWPGTCTTSLTSGLNSENFAAMIKLVPRSTSTLPGSTVTLPLAKPNADRSINVLFSANCQNASRNTVRAAPW